MYVRVGGGVEVEGWNTRMIDILLAPIEKKHIIRHLLELYVHDMSEWEQTDVNEAGLYGYKYLDHFWTEDGRYPYLMTADGHYCGFAFVRTAPVQGEYNSIAEFFIMRKYRKHGLARHLLEYVHEHHLGEWSHSAHINNLVSQAMCRKVFPALAVDGVQETVSEDTVEWRYTTSPNKHNPH